MKKLILPGWQNSGPEHWQTKWEQLDTSLTRVQQDDWERPDFTAWSQRLESHLTEPTVLIAHSLGCFLASRARKNVAAALLVAPPKLGGIAELASFASLPLEPLPFPSVVVASRNDAYCDFGHAEQLAAAWGSGLVDGGERGHLNSESNLGTWSEGRSLLRALVSVLPFELDHRLKNDTFIVGESELNLLLLLNDSRYVWFMLVPKRSGVEDVHQLLPVERAVLAQESNALSLAIEKAFSPDKLNVAALGNVVRQLHVHHVVRRLGDTAWPGPVWGHSPRVPYVDESWRAHVEKLFAVDARWRNDGTGR